MLCLCVLGARVCVVFLLPARGGTLCAVCQLLEVALCVLRLQRVPGASLCVVCPLLARGETLYAVCQRVLGVTLCVLCLCVLGARLCVVCPLLARAGTLCVVRLMLMPMLTLMLMLMLMHMLMQTQILLCVRKPLGPRMGGMWVGCLPFLSWVLFMVGQSQAHMLSLCRLAGPPPVWGLV